jgi:hypothetical protein
LLVTLERPGTSWFLYVAARRLPPPSPQVS